MFAPRRHCKRMIEKGRDGTTPAIVDSVPGTQPTVDGVNDAWASNEKPAETVKGTAIDTCAMSPLKRGRGCERTEHTHTPTNRRYP
jgi:hypothetical protein